MMKKKKLKRDQNPERRSKYEQSDNDSYANMNEGVKTLKKLYFFDRDRETDRKKRHRDIGTERYKNKEKYKKIERQRDREI
jgi:hypothetical protein